MDQSNKKEEILEAARNNKQNEYEAHIGYASVLITSLTACVVGLALFVVEMVFKGTKNFGLIAVALTASSVMYLYEGIKLKNILKIILGSIFAVIAIVLISGYLWQVVS